MHYFTTPCVELLRFEERELVLASDRVLSGNEVVLTSLEGNPVHLHVQIIEEQGSSHPHTYRVRVEGPEKLIDSLCCLLPAERPTKMHPHPHLRLRPPESECGHSVLARLESITPVGAVLETTLLFRSGAQLVAESLPGEAMPPLRIPVEVLSSQLQGTCGLYPYIAEIAFHGEPGSALAVKRYLSAAKSP